MTFTDQITISYGTKDNYTSGYAINNFPANGTVKNLKISNNKLAKVSWRKSDKELIWFQPLSTGSAKVTFDVVYGKKTQHFKSKVTITRYQSPCKSFKVGTKDYASKFKNAHYSYQYGTKNKKSKVSIKAISGWKVTNIYYYNGKTGKNIKNNSNVTLRPGSCISVNLYNSKTQKYECISLSFFN